MRGACGRGKWTLPHRFVLLLALVQRSDELLLQRGGMRSVSRPAAVDVVMMGRKFENNKLKMAKTALACTHNQTAHSILTSHCPCCTSPPVQTPKRPRTLVRRWWSLSRLQETTRQSIASWLP